MKVPKLQTTKSAAGGFTSLDGISSILQTRIGAVNAQPRASDIFLEANHYSSGSLKGSGFQGWLVQDSEFLEIPNELDLEQASRRLLVPSTRYMITTAMLLGVN